MSFKTSYIPGIDGLRAVAVISVILFHLHANLLPGGFSGVDIFFVISGYVVSSSLAKERVAGFWRFAVDFYARRILRIYPALVLCLLVSSLMQTLFVPPSWLSTSTERTGLAAFFGLSNFALILLSDGYFSPRVEFNVFTHTWSLAVEEQFYLLFPAIFFLWLTGHRRIGVWRALSNVLLAILLVASLGYAWYQTNADPESAFYLLPSRFWELACGAALYMYQYRNRTSTSSVRLANATALVGLILIAAGFALIDHKAFPFPWALLPVSGALLVLHAVTSDASQRSIVVRLLDNRAMVYVGKLSYSLYLWHWPVLVFFRWTVGADDAASLFAVAAISILASMASFHLVERPLRQHPALISRSRGQIVVAGVGIIVLSMTGAFALFQSQPALTLSVTKDIRTWYPYTESGVVSREVTNSANPAPDFRGRRLFVLGDSHADAYMAMFQMLRDETGAEVKQFSKAGCSVASLITLPRPHCVWFQKELFDKVLTDARPGDIVFIASRRINILGDQWETFDDNQIREHQEGPEAQRQREAALTDADTIVKTLESRNLIVVIDAPKPAFRSPPFRCADWFNAGNPVCKGGFTIDREFLLEHRQPIMNSIEQLKQTHPKLVIWDPFFALCPGAVCKVEDDQRQPLFFDGDHLSGHGNRVLYPTFRTFLESIWRATDPEGTRATTTDFRVTH